VLCESAEIDVVAFTYAMLSRTLSHFMNTLANLLAKILSDGKIPSTNPHHAKTKLLLQRVIPSLLSLFSYPNIVSAVASSASHVKRARVKRYAEHAAEKS